MNEVLGVNNALLLYTENFKKAFAQSSDSVPSIISIGSGDCTLEISIVERLAKDGLDNFRLLCTDLSQQRLDRGKAAAEKRGVARYMDFAAVDVNEWSPDRQYDGIIAHHVLHHVVELEQLFAAIRNMMAPNARFVTCDMIGRNGHMRWEEALKITEDIWAFMPDTFKYNHQFKKQHDEFVNWDCSTRGFEGIRAQDILQLLVNEFQFENFLAYGNLVDPFVERGYGHNLDAENPKDRAFVDFLENLNTLLIDVGHLKPTMMMATMIAGETAQTAQFRHWSPQFCVRKVKD